LQRPRATSDQDQHQQRVAHAEQGAPGQRPLEAFVVALLTLIFACFAIQLLLSRPELGEVLQGFLPSPRVPSDPAALYLAIG
ncbi:divalent metal cation transporter, partial [Pseudomonas aeruginosa]